MKLVKQLFGAIVLTGMVTSAFSADGKPVGISPDLMSIDVN